jgi:hypothetical protein
MTTFAEVEAGIRQLHARYSDATWRKDAGAFAECFTPDGEWRISGMVLKGRPQIAETIDRILSRMNRVLISFRTPLLDLSADGVTGRTMIDERVSWADGSANVSIGRYYERFVEADGRWFFSWRLFQLHYRGPPDLSGTWFDHPDYGPPPGMPPLDAGTEDMASKRWDLPEGHGKQG